MGVVVSILNYIHLVISYDSTTLEAFEIVHQSGNVRVEIFITPVALYCIPSLHSSDVVYSWELLGKEPMCFPCSPVVMVGMGGTYKCSYIWTESPCI